MVTLENYIDALAGHLKEPFVCKESLNRIKSVSRKLPLVSMAGFESILGSDSAMADFSVNIGLDTPAFNSFSGIYDSEEYRSLFTHPVWKSVRAFCKEIQNPVSDVYGKVNDFWLEFDLQNDPLEIPVPAFFCSPSQAEKKRPLAFYDSHLVPIVKTLLGEDLPDTFRGNLMAVLSALPEHGRIFHTGAMLSRRLNGLRLCLSGLSVQELGKYILTLGLLKSESDFRALVDGLETTIDEFVLSIDVGEYIYPRFGIECYVKSQDIRETIARWTKVLNCLEAKGMCTPEKKMALLSWPGYSFINEGHEKLSPAVRLLQNRASLALLRGWSHIKIVRDVADGISVKGYFGFARQWVPVKKIYTKNLEDA